MWRKRGQKKEKGQIGNSRTLERSFTLPPSPEETGSEGDNQFAPLPLRPRSRTFANGDVMTGREKHSMSASSLPKCCGDVFQGLDTSFSSSSLSKRTSDIFQEFDVPLTFVSRRHLNRRRALVQSELQEDISYSLPKPTKQVLKRVHKCSEDEQYVTITVEDHGCNIKDCLPVQDTQSLRNILEPLLMKNNLFIADLTQYHILATQEGSSIAVDLDASSTQYCGCVVNVRPRGWVKEVNGSSKTFCSVTDCLAYFSTHGLVELPNTNIDEDSYQLPRVTPIDPIATSWEDLPIDSQVKNSLSSKERDQQHAIWELISTEHSLLRQLEVVINVFMRCLELIRKAKVLNEDGYHNVFGYMEEIYDAHVKFWSWTLEPCLETVYETHSPLKLSEIVERHPTTFHTHFEIYKQHCALESLNLRALNEAMLSHDFSTYLNWCEARPECHRLKLKDFLAMPMQRLMKYPLLFTAISKETTDITEKQQLEHVMSDVQVFVQSVNQVLWVQEETERVRDAMNRITAYSAVEMPSDLKEIITPHTHLDLLAPMPGVEVDKPRILLLEGNLKFRDPTTARMVVHVFLFTDLLLLTKPTKGKNFTIVRPPCKITSLVLHHLEPDSFCVLLLNEYHVVTTWFTLRANSASVADEWMKQINAAQQLYTEAVEQKAQNWELLHSLQEERTLNGTENLDSISCNSSLSQSLFSLNTLPRQKNGLTASNDSLPSEFNSTRTEKQSLMRTQSGGVLTRMCSSQLDLTGAHTHWLQRTSSLSKLQEMPESEVVLQVADLHSTTNPDAISRKFRSMSVDIATQTEMLCNSTAELYNFRRSPTSDDSSTESETLNRALSPLSTSSLSHESPVTLERLEAMEATGSPMKRDSTGSMSSAKSSSPSSERKLKSILRTSSTKFVSNGLAQSNNILSPASTILHTVLPVSSTSEESDASTNPSSPKVEVVQCHTTETNIETVMGAQRRSESVQFNVTFVESSLMSEDKKGEETMDPEEETMDPDEETMDPEDETMDPEDETMDPEEETMDPEEETMHPEEETMHPEEETTTDADKPETTVSLEEASRSSQNCEPRLQNKSLSSEATSEQQALIAERNTKNDKQNQNSEKPSPKHKVMFSPDTKSSSPTAKQRNKSIGSFGTYSSANLATSFSAKRSTLNPKHHDSELSKYQTWRGRPDVRRNSFPHTTRVEVQRNHLSGSKARITPVHQRLTGRGVRELSQMFETPSGSTEPTSSSLSSGPKSASSRIPLSACGKHAGSQKLRAQTNSKLGTEATDSPIPQRFNTSSSDTEKRRTAVHSRSLSQPAQSGSKPNAQSGTESTQRKLRTKSETLYATKQGILKQRPNGTVNTRSSSDIGSRTQVGPKCANSNSNNNCHQRHGLSLPCRGKQHSGIPVVRFSEGQNSRQTSRHLPHGERQTLNAEDKC